MPTSSASQFIEYKRRLAIQNNTIPRPDRKTITEFSVFSSHVSSVSLPNYLANPTYKPPVEESGGGGNELGPVITIDMPDISNNSRIYNTLTVISHRKFRLLLTDTQGETPITSIIILLDRTIDDPGSYNVSLPNTGINIVNTGKPPSASEITLTPSEIGSMNSISDYIYFTDVPFDPTITSITINYTSRNDGTPAGSSGDGAPRT